MNKKDLINGLILLALGIWIWLYSGRFPSLEEGYPGPSLFPRLIAVGLFLSGIGLLIGAIRIPGNRLPEFQMVVVKYNWWRFVLGIVLVCLYPVFHPLIGFVPTLGAICFGMGLLMKVRIWIAALTAIVTAGLLQILFSNLLGVAL